MCEEEEKEAEAGVKFPNLHSILLKLKTGCEQSKKNVNKQSPLLKPLLFVLLTPLAESMKNTKVMCGVQFPSASCTNEAGDSFNLWRKNLLQLHQCSWNNLI